MSKRVIEEVRPLTQIADIMKATKFSIISILIACYSIIDPIISLIEILIKSNVI